MQTPSAMNYDVAWLASLKPSEREQIWKSLAALELASFRDDFLFWSNEEQRPPAGDWRTWVFMGGRGAGKTRAGAEWVSEIARRGYARRIALIGPTFHDVREVMVQGQSGILSLPHRRPDFEPSRRRVVWPSGAVAQYFSAEDPASLRGPQFDAAWLDELCYWAAPDETLATLAHAMRLGQRPRTLVTTTPRPIAALKTLLASPSTKVTRGGTTRNAANLAPGFVEELRRTWSGTVRERQEVLGELIEDLEGALWTRESIEAALATKGGSLERIVVAIDPPVGLGVSVDACGIVAAGVWRDENGRRCGVVLSDASVQGLTPQGWAERAADLARSVGAHEIIAEANNGGELVRAVLALAAPGVRIRLVRASVDKRSRAAPVTMYYAQGRVAHAARFPALEDEMCSFGAPGFKGSPDRLDALVWALTDLLGGSEGPRFRTL